MRQIPSVWAVMGQKRVLNHALSYRDQALLLLYESEEPVLVEDLIGWV